MALTLPGLELRFPALVQQINRMRCKLFHVTQLSQSNLNNLKSLARDVHKFQYTFLGGAENPWSKLSLYIYFIFYILLEDVIDSNLSNLTGVISRPGYHTAL